MDYYFYLIMANVELLTDFMLPGQFTGSHPPTTTSIILYTVCDQYFVNVITNVTTTKRRPITAACQEKFWIKDNLISCVKNRETIIIFSYHYYISIPCLNIPARSKSIVVQGLFIYD